MKFGMPYKGSKNAIAEKIISVLPPAEHFYDLFGGGGAMTHCALLSGKYKHVHYNELDPLVFKGFKMAVNGEFKNENRWISREDFERLKDSDPYVAICFSFGNSLHGYAYNEDREKFKKAVHYSICFDDNSLLKDYIPINDFSYTSKQIHDRRSELQRYFKKFLSIDYKDVLENIISYVNVIIDKYPRVTNICQNLQSLERLNNLNDIKNIVCTNLSYDELDFETDSVIYCDPPYKNTSSYKINFNHEEFYDWCRKQKNIFISEYNMPDDFLCLGAVNKNVILDRNNKAKKKQEKIFTNNHYEERFILC